MLNFLKEIKVNEAVVASKKGSGGGGRKAWNPTQGLTLRLWKSGAIFPSQALVSRFNLEYGPKPTDPKVGMTGNGLDIFQSKDFPTLDSPEQLVFVNIAPRSKGKIDVFKTVDYPKDGSEHGSVMEQGATSFGSKTLLGMIKDTYKVDLNEAGFIDLVFLGPDGEAAKKTFLDKPFCHVPKQINRGPKAKEMSYQRREHPAIYALYPLSLIEKQEAAEGGDALDKLKSKHPDAVEEVQ